MQKRAYISRISSIVLFAVGITLLVNSKTGIIGAAVGVSAALSLSLSFIFGLAFMIAAVIMFAAGELSGRESLENTIKRSLRVFGYSADTKPVVTLDANYLIEGYKTSAERVNGVGILQHEGYPVMVPKSLKEEVREMNDVKDAVNPPAYKDDLLKETETAIRKTEKYKKGSEFLKYKNREEAPLNLRLYFGKEREKIENEIIGRVRSGIAHIEDVSPENSWESLKQLVKRRYVDIERDADILASVVTTVEQSPVPVVLVSSDGHMAEAVDYLTETHPILAKKLIYIHPKEEKIIKL